MSRRRRAFLALDVYDLQVQVRVPFYGRVSANPKQVSKSIPGQLKLYYGDLRKRPNWTDAGHYSDDNRSASPFRTQERDDWERFCKDIAAGMFDMIWVWEWSRGNRDVTDFGALADLLAQHRVLVYVYSLRRVFDLNNPQDVVDLAQESVNANRESVVTSRRVRESAVDSLDNGTPWGWIKYGYRRVYDTYTGKLVRQEAHPARAKVVKEIAHRYALDESQQSIARDLTRRKIESPSDAQYNDAHPDEPNRITPWDDVTVRRFATSPVYIGQRVYTGVQDVGDAVFDGDWEPLVDLDTHLACVRRYQRAQVLDAQHRPAGTLVHLLTRILKCGVCDLPATIKTLKSGVRYRCPIGHTSAKEVVVDAFVVGVLLTWLARPDVARRLTRDRNPEALGHRKQLAKLQQEIADLRANLEVNGANATAKAIKAVQERVKAVQEQLAQLSLPPRLRSLFGTPSDVAAAWQGLTLAQQRAVIDDVMVVKLEPAGRGNRQWNGEHRVTIEWRL